MDALRGLAALGIVGVHAYNAIHTRAFPGHGYLDNLAEGLAIGVPVFFALSGFLLFRPALAALARGARPPGALTFWRRRALRILPAYWVALTLTALLVPDAARGAFSDRWWVFYLFGQSFSLTDNFHGLAVAWTLSVEVCFYLVLPALVALVAVAARRVGWERAAWGLIVPLFLLGPVIHFLNTFEFDSRGLVLFIQKITYALPGETNFFAVGMALAVLSVRERTPPLARRPTLTWSLAGLVFALIALAFCFTHPYGGLDFRTRFVGYDLLATAFTALVLLPAAFDLRPGLPRAVLAWPPMVFVGVVSYGLYLWHVPAETWLLDHGLGPVQAWSYVPRVLVTFLVVGAPSLFLATVSHYVVELPFLRRKDRARASGSASGSA